MRNFNIQSVGNQAVITVDLSFINIESLNRLFERLRTEQLIQKADFSDEITEIGTEIKQSWWQKNRADARLGRAMGNGRQGKVDV